MLLENTEPDAMGTPHERDDRGDRQRQEPAGLVIRRRHGKIEMRTGFVPHTAVVARGDAEAVVARTKIVVERLPTSPNVLPIAVLAVEPVAETCFLWCDKAQRRVVDLHVARQRRKSDPSISGRNVEAPVVGGDLLNAHRRRKGVERNTMRIEDSDAAWGCEPELPVRQHGGRRVETDRHRQALDTVGADQRVELDRTVRIGNPRSQFRWTDAYQPA